MPILEKCDMCNETYNKSDILGTLECGHWYHYHCIVFRIKRFGNCFYCPKILLVEDIKVVNLTPKSSESHACSDEKRLLKTEVAKISEKEERQNELVALLKHSIKTFSEDNNLRFNELKTQLELSSQIKCDLRKRLDDREKTIESLQKANAQLEVSSRHTNELLQGQLSERDKTIEILSQEIAQLKPSSHNTPNTSELYKRPDDYEATIACLKQEIAHLKLGSSNNDGLAQCLQVIEKTMGSLVKSIEQTSTQQKILLCACNSAELDESKKLDQSMQKNSNALKTLLEEYENKRFMQLDAQLAESNKNLLELQKRMLELKNSTHMELSDIIKKILSKMTPERGQF